MELCTRNGLGVEQKLGQLLPRAQVPQPHRPCFIPGRHPAAVRGKVDRPYRPPVPLVRLDASFASNVPNLQLTVERPRRKDLPVRMKVEG